MGPVLGREVEVTPVSDFDDNELEAPTATAVLEHIVRSIVDDADAVSVSSSTGRGDKVKLEVRVGPGDLGRVIGRRGRTAQSIRTVVRAAAVTDDVDVDVDFVDA
jgi:predicted RNA-binding protein YlqC (UPF0109 family)